VLDVQFTDDTISVNLRDGRVITVPLVWYPRPLEATPSRRKNWKIAGGGCGIHWPNIDEDFKFAVMHLSQMRLFLSLIVNLSISRNSSHRGPPITFLYQGDTTYSQYRRNLFSLGLPEYDLRHEIFRFGHG
jgi:hypothetical protein